MNDDMKDTIEFLQDMEKISELIYKNTAWRHGSTEAHEQLQRLITSLQDKDDRSAVSVGADLKIYIGFQKEHVYRSVSHLFTLLDKLERKLDFIVLRCGGIEDYDHDTPNGLYRMCDKLLERLEIFASESRQQENEKC